MATRRAVSDAPPVSCLTSTSPAVPRRGKGAKHASVVPGPFVAALDLMPQAPLVGAKRARAGLADEPLRHSATKAIYAERAARALVSILPFGCAGFVLHDPPDLVASRSPAANAELMVRVLEKRGVSSLDAAYSTLGRLLAFVRATRPGATSVAGSDVSAFLSAHPPSEATTSSIRWLRDWCGLDLPARGAAAGRRRAAPGEAPLGAPVAPPVARDNESLSFKMTLHLEALAARHPSVYVRGHAAGWLFLARHALRFEQSCDCAISASVVVSCGDVDVTVIFGAVTLDKNPDAAKQKPRPFWGCFEGLLERDAPFRALAAMLDGVESLRFILRDTDSPSGDPCDPSTSRWVAAALSSSRVDASLHGLLQLPPLSMARDDARRYHRHSGKRYLFNVADSSPAFSLADANEVGRFSGSVAQDPDLVPEAALLARHDLRARLLPSMYARKSKVATVLKLVARLHLVQRDACALFAAMPGCPHLAAMPAEGGWGPDGVFAPAPASASAPPRITLVSGTPPRAPSS